MDSTCPNCKKKNEHEDYLFEVACSCGSRYNPFMPLDEAPAAASLPTPDPQFAEANAAFADIRNFGDENLSPAVPPSLPEKVAFTELSAPPPPGAPSSNPPATSPPRPVSAAAASVGAVVSPLEPLPPVSACVDFDGSLPDPLSPLVEKLWQRATSAGASACTELRWAFSPDGQKLLGSCVPVRRA
jgi:hypothetical protein